MRVPARMRATGAKAEADTIKMNRERKENMVLRTER
jgi:hypothetical protein